MLESLPQVVISQLRKFSKSQAYLPIIEYFFFFFVLNAVLDSRDRKMSKIRSHFQSSLMSSVLPHKKLAVLGT